MTIKQAAAKYQVSPQAIYQRLKKKKIFVESLTDKETGELSAEGELIIDNLFNPEKQPFKANSRAYADEQENQIKQLNIDKAVLVEKIKLLEEKVSFLQDQLGVVNKALEESQGLQKQMMNRLLPGEGQTVAGDQRRLTWRERFTGKISK